MKKSLCVLAAALFALAAGRADEEKVPLDKMPAAIKDSVKKRFPKAEMVEGAKETDDAGKTVYEVEVKLGKRKIDVTLTPEGVITTIEQEMAAKDFPKAVTAAIEAKYPKSTIKFAEKVLQVKDGKETLDYYEALLMAADKKEYELEVAADGTIKKTEEKKPEGEKGEKKPESKPPTRN